MCSLSRRRRSVRASSTICEIMSEYDRPDFFAAMKNSELLESHGFGLASITYTSFLGQPHIDAAIVAQLEDAIGVECGRAKQFVRLLVQVFHRSGLGDLVGLAVL